MDFFSTDFDYQSAWNAYLPTSQYFAVFSPIFRLLRLGFTWFGHGGKFVEKSLNFIVLRHRNPEIGQFEKGGKLLFLF